MSFRGSLRKIENKKNPQLAASWTAKPKITDEKKTDSIAEDIFGGIGLVFLWENGRDSRRHAKPRSFSKPFRIDFATVLYRFSVYQFISSFTVFFILPGQA
jgi:hypothetical protein